MASLHDKVDEEVEHLKRDIVRLGTANAEGNYEVKYGVLFDDEKVEQFYEALLGTLKAARKKGVIDFKGQMLLKGAHDNVPIVLLQPPGDAPPPPPPSAKPEPQAAAEPEMSPEMAALQERIAHAESAAPVAAPAANPRNSFIRSAAAPRTGGPMDMFPPTEKTPEMMEAFARINASHPDDQCEMFLKSFIFALGDKWKEVNTLLKEYRKHAHDTSGGANDESMNHIQASDFLQKHGKTRTGTERKAELNDVDIDNDGMISFMEYLLLHYKVMILEEFYKRYEMEPEEDLSNDGIGVVNVGHKLVDELLTMPKGLSPQLEAAIESFTEEKKAREKKVAELTQKAAAGGVKGMAAKNELIILEQGDQTEINRIELTLMAAKRRAEKRRGSQLLEEQKAKAAAELKKAHEEQRARMAARRAMFEKK